MRIAEVSLASKSCGFIVAFCPLLKPRYDPEAEKSTRKKDRHRGDEDKSEFPSKRTCHGSSADDGNREIENGPKRSTTYAGQLIGFDGEE